MIFRASLSPELLAMAGDAGRQSVVLLTHDDYAEVLLSAFKPDAMFETAAVPAATLRRLRKEIFARKPVGVSVRGPRFYRGDLRLIVGTGGAMVRITARPNGGCQIEDVEGP